MSQEGLSGRIGYDVLNRIQYIGKALAGSTENAEAWSIKLLTYDGTSHRITAEGWPGGDSSPKWRWDLRDIYAYS